MLTTPQKNVIGFRHQLLKDYLDEETYNKVFPLSYPSSTDTIPSSEASHLIGCVFDLNKYHLTEEGDKEKLVKEIKEIADKYIKV